MPAIYSMMANSTDQKLNDNEKGTLLKKIISC